METGILIRMIKDRETTRTKLQHQLEPLIIQRDALDVEINVLKEALEKAEGKKASPAGPKRERALQEHWAKTLKFIGSNLTADLSDINNYITNTLDLAISPDTQRSQLANYVNRGWLSRVKEGVFQLTESGAAKCGYTAQKQETPVVGVSAGEASTSSINSGATQKDDLEDEIPF